MPRLNNSDGSVDVLIEQIRGMAVSGQSIFFLTDMIFKSPQKKKKSAEAKKTIIFRIVTQKFWEINEAFRA